MSQIKPQASADTHSSTGKESRVRVVTFNVDDIIHCYHLCFPSKHRAQLEAAKAKADEANKEKNGVETTDKSEVGARDSSVVAGSSHVNSSTGKKKPRHIHRVSVMSRQQSFQSASPTSSFHERRLSLVNAVHKAFQPTSRVTSSMCTVPFCVARRRLRQTGSQVVESSTKNETHKHESSLQTSAKSSATAHAQGSIYIKHYLDAFRELCKLIQQFGSTLSFVVDNLMIVIETMDFHVNSGRGSHYEHVEMMIKYETTYQLIQRKTKGKDSGTRALLLLHRSLSFILEFIMGLKNSGPKTRSTTIAQEAFDSTIAKYYSWLIKQMASMAFSSLPTTQDCLSRISNGEPKNAPAILKNLLEAATPVYNRVHEIYGKYHQLKAA